jgi:D-lactate dehydrogenase (cytochrome)
MITKTDPQDMASYMEDPSNLKGTEPEKIFLPATEAEVSEVVKEAAAQRKPLTVSAGGTGVVGGRIPSGGWVVSMEKLNKIKDIDIANKTASLESGVVVDAFLDELKKPCLFYPPFPTEKSAFIGGTAATNASGEYTYHFGGTRAYVRGLSVVLPDGQKLSLTRGQHVLTNGKIALPGRSSSITTAFRSPNLEKSSCGYFMQEQTDLVDLFIGSEGTLGIITALDVSLIDAPRDPMFCVAFLSAPKALEFQQLLESSPLAMDLLALEYFDRHALDLLSAHARIPAKTQEAVLFILDLNDEKMLDQLDQLLTQPYVVDTWASDSAATAAKIYEFRWKLPESVNELVKEKKLVKLSSDLAVPPDKHAEMFRYYTELLDPAGVRYVLFGHLGESHLHVNFLPEPDQKDQAEELYIQLLKKAVSLGGTISAEHGIGKKKKKYLPLMFSAAQLTEMKKIKDYVDPLGIMGAGNIF